MLLVMFFVWWQGLFCHAALALAFFVFLAAFAAVLVVAGGLCLLQSHLDVLDERFARVGGSGGAVGFEVQSLVDRLANELLEHLFFSSVEIGWSLLVVESGDAGDASIADADAHWCGAVISHHLLGNLAGVDYLRATGFALSHCAWCKSCNGSKGHC